jgi:hypothetical protein
MTATTNYYEASPTKLKSGAWGARVKSDSVEKGDPIKVTTKSGKSWTTYVSRVVWSGNGVSIVSTSKTGLGYTPAVRNARGYVVERGHYDGYCGYPCPVTGRKCCPKNGPCHDCL